MGTELINRHVKEENFDFPSIPPGFESFAPFSVKTENDSRVASGSSVSTSASAMQTTKKEPEDDKLKRSLRRRSGINYGRFDCNSDDDFESNPFDLIVIP